MATQSSRITDAPKVGGNAKNILAWEDDPGSISGDKPVSRPVPDLRSKPLAIKITETAPRPRNYPLDTKEFRYWDTADAVRRAVAFWAPLLPSGLSWQVGAVLPVHLDRGTDLNAFYTRGDNQDPPGLSFFHAKVFPQTAVARQAIGGNPVTVFSAESPDVVCHETGHAVLDAIRPQLFDAMSVEVAAFHESFGDMSAILSVLQLPSLDTAVIEETAGKLYRSSRVSRLAEQLGWAIRQSHPDAVDPDCLRNAVNSFFYRDPQTLPPDAPASLLSTEPHSFSRVFTAGFFEAFAGMVLSQTQSPKPADLRQASRDAGQLLVDAILASPVVPDYYSQVAAHMLEADDHRFNRKYRDALKGAFVRRGILSLDSAASSTSSKGAAPKRKGVRGNGRAAALAQELPLMAIAAPEYGLGKKRFLVHTPADQKRFSVTSSSYVAASAPPASHETDSRAFVEDLFQRGRIDIGPHGDPDTRIPQPFVRKTHRLLKRNGDLVLKRRMFDCGFD